MTTIANSAPSMPLVPTDEERMLRESVRGVVSKFGPDYFIRVSDSGEWPGELWDAFVEKGFVAVHIPERHGGGGQGLSECAVIYEESAAAGCPLLFMVLTPGITGSLLNRHATDEQQQRWLAPLARGELRMAFAITEPGAGSNSQKIATSARKEGPRWVLNGQKTYISAINHSAEVLVVAKTAEDERGRSKLSLFVVPTDAPGLSYQPIPTAVTMTEKQFTVFFDDVEVDETRLLSGEDEGFRVVFDGLNPERILVAALATGIGRYAERKAIEYARERAVWDTPIGAHQAIAHPLAEGHVMLEQARLMTQKAAALYDAGLPAGEASNMAKLTAAEAGIFCLDHAIQTHGGNGLALEYQLANYWFLARLLRIAPVSREMLLNQIAEHTLGLPRSY
ncbi:MAG: acyl-CoA dehydrogenase family protein [Solirubrobacteraceae bacterium]